MPGVCRPCGHGRPPARRVCAREHDHETPNCQGATEDRRGPRPSTVKVPRSAWRTRLDRASRPAPPLGSRLASRRSPPAHRDGARCTGWARAAQGAGAKRSESRQCHRHGQNETGVVVGRKNHYGSRSSAEPRSPPSSIRCAKALAWSASTRTPICTTPWRPRSPRQVPSRCPTSCCRLPECRSPVPCRR